MSRGKPPVVRTKPPLSVRPRVSVVMPVHNALPHLDEAVESILGQTYRDFEFVILDDASTDGSTERLRYWASKDPRIRLFEVDTNLGPVGSSQRVADEAASPVVARMDADDISYPERLAEELAVLDRHPDVGVVASLADIIDSRGRKLRDPEPWRLARRSVFVPFAHGAMMYRKEVFDRVGGYRKECEYWEDQDLVTRMSTVSRIMVLPRALYRIRQSTTSTRVVSDRDRLERAADLAYRSTDRLARGLDYEDLLHRPAGVAEKVDPRVFIAVGSVLLWAGGKPRLFRRLLKRGKLSFNFGTLSALVWTAWASSWPGSLRIFLKLLLLARNGFAGGRVSTHEPVLWTPLPKRDPIASQARVAAAQ